MKQTIKIIKIAAIISTVAVLSACAPNQKSYVCKDNDGQQRTLVIADNILIYDNIAYQVPEHQFLNGYWHVTKSDPDTKVSTSIYLNTKAMEIDFLLRVDGLSRSHHIAFCSKI